MTDDYDPDMVSSGWVSCAPRCGWTSAYWDGGEQAAWNALVDHWNSSSCTYDREKRGILATVRRWGDRVYRFWLWRN